MFAILVLLCSVSLVSVSQTTKRKPRPKPKPKLDLSILDKPFTTPCGVTYKNFDESWEEAEQEWRIASAATDGDLYYYNTKKKSCEKGILRVWVKGVKPDNKTITRSMTRYELNCRTNQLRQISSIDYYDNGKISETSNPSNPRWYDATPDTVGESILETVCHKSP
jgi:hypothetical protein